METKPKQILGLQRDLDPWPLHEWYSAFQLTNLVSSSLPVKGMKHEILKNMNRGNTNEMKMRPLQ